MDKLKLIIFIVVFFILTCVVFAQKTGDLRFTDKLEIFLSYQSKTMFIDTTVRGSDYFYSVKYDKHSGWFDFDSLYQTRDKDGNIDLGFWDFVNLDIIQSERERFQAFIDEYFFNTTSSTSASTRKYLCEDMLISCDKMITELRNRIKGLLEKQIKDKLNEGLKHGQN